MGVGDGQRLFSCLPEEKFVKIVKNIDKIIIYIKNVCTFASLNNEEILTITNLLYIMETKTYTHRLYINEYNKELVKQISYNKIEGLYCTDESTDKVLCIEGTLENLNKLSSLMYCDDFAQIKSIFPSFLTQEDCDRDAKELRDEIKRIFASKMLAFGEKYDGTSFKSYRNEDYRFLFDIYVKMI